MRIMKSGAIKEQINHRCVCGESATTQFEYLVKVMVLHSPSEKTKVRIISCDRCANLIQKLGLQSGPRAVFQHIASGPIQEE